MIDFLLNMFTWLNINTGLFITAIIALLIHWKEIKSNHDWNRRHAAIINTKHAREKINNDLKIINKYFDYKHRGRYRAISVQQIHDVICIVKDESKDKDNGRYEPDTEGHQQHKLRTKKDNFEHSGEQIRDAIHKVLNTYEYLASGVHQKVFDEKVIKNLLKDAIKKAYFVFKEYIEHYNNEMKDGGDTWCELEKLAKKFKEEDKTKDKEQKNTA